MKNNKSQKISISVSSEHEKYLPDIKAAFESLEVEYVGGLMRFSAQEMAMQVMIFLTTAFIGGAAWDILKIGVNKLYKKFPKAHVTIRGNDSIMYTIRPDMTINVIVTPDRMKEFEKIKSFDDLVEYLQSNEKTTHNDIPSGWKKERLGNVSSFANGKAHENNIVESGKYIVVNSKFVSSNGLVYKTTNKSLSPLSKGDVAMVMSDIPNGKAIAKCYLVKEDNKFTLNQRIGVLRSKQIDSNFLYYLLNRNRYFLSFDDGVNQTNLRKDDILNCPVIFPSLPEQQRIVSVLEAWDRAIEKLARKIEIKKNVKKGLMQNLLTGKVRLAGFKDEWKSIKLSDICKRIRTGKLDANAMIKNGKYRFYTCAKNYYKINDYAFDTEALLVSGNGANVGYIHYYKGKFNAYQRTYVLDKFTSDIMFTKYILDQHLRKRIFEEKCDGNTPYIKMGTLTEMKLEIPETKDEQEKIADVIITADSEIKMLEKKLSIMKDQKKYLLDNLVTGKIRIKT